MSLPLLIADADEYLLWKLHVYFYFSSHGEDNSEDIIWHPEVWEFPSSVIFIIDSFVLSSYIVALKVLAESAMSRCVGACLSAHAVKLLASQVLDFRLLGY
ncbi:Arv1-like protein [Quillaja saponaria]|uniref:Arv1-like protein n=1 Tax=Quillaja saponaria TaxID=32244 RepID=A0AAD7PDS4_QUISA|nr:Arv1-like protein [Quillaja saponaria]